MCVDAGVPGGARQVLVFSVRDVLVRARVTVFLRESKVNHVHEVPLLAETHQEVVGFHVAVDEVLRVDVFYAADLWERPNK